MGTGPVTLVPSFQTSKPNCSTTTIAVTHRLHLSRLTELGVIGEVRISSCCWRVDLTEVRIIGGACAAAVSLSEPDWAARGSIAGRVEVIRGGFGNWARSSSKSVKSCRDRCGIRWARDDGLSRRVTSNLECGDYDVIACVLNESDVWNGGRHDAHRGPVLCHPRHTCICSATSYARSWVPSDPRSGQPAKGET
jgi:hypothetical protein